eukprot:Clim_evm11s226 gene=Clim_evmTU11s226
MALHGLREVVIASAARTPVGSFLKSLSSVPAPHLGAAAITGALKKAGIEPKDVQQVVMGNVISAGMGQAPARQAAKGAGCEDSTVCITVNKVCSSGMQSIIYGAQDIALGNFDIVVSGGMENMSLVPHYMEHGRDGFRLGGTGIVDGILKDGLTDVYGQYHMGICGENTAEVMGFTREQQDDYALMSYERAEKAWAEGKFKEEVVPVIVEKRGKEVVVDEDEEYKHLNKEKFRSLKSVFKKNGTVTAGNASPINDGASAMVLMSREKADAMGVKPIARIIGYGNAEKAPIDFPTAPALAVEKALTTFNLKKEDIGLWEFNEAFSVVALANLKLLGLDASKVNVNGGAVSLGHPIGSSGCRITGTLAHAMMQRGEKFGCAAICNGGGGASAIILENLRL